MKPGRTKKDHEYCSPGFPASRLNLADCASQRKDGGMQSRGSSQGNPYSLNFLHSAEALQTLHVGDDILSSCKNPVAQQPKPELLEMALKKSINSSVCLNMAPADMNSMQDTTKQSAIDATAPRRKLFSAHGVEGTSVLLQGKPLASPENDWLVPKGHAKTVHDFGISEFPISASRTTPQHSSSPRRLLRTTNMTPLQHYLLHCSMRDGGNTFLKELLSTSADAPQPSSRGSTMSTYLRTVSHDSGHALAARIYATYGNSAADNLAVQKVDKWRGFTETKTQDGSSDAPHLAAPFSMTYDGDGSNCREQEVIFRQLQCLYPNGTQRDYNDNINIRWQHQHIPPPLHATTVHALSPLVRSAWLCRHQMVPSTPVRQIEAMSSTFQSPLPHQQTTNKTSDLSPFCSLQACADPPPRKHVRQFTSNSSRQDKMYYSMNAISSPVANAASDSLRRKSTQSTSTSRQVDLSGTSRTARLLSSHVFHTQNKSQLPYRLETSIAIELPTDSNNLSPYQCFVRKQIDLFVAQKEEVQCGAQGRNRPIVLGQVGIICHHCANIRPENRTRGAVYFPARRIGLYQAAQNMVINHLTDNTCPAVPEETRGVLLRLKELKSPVMGGGKRYWANGAKILGVVESDSRLFLEEYAPRQPAAGSKVPPGAR